MSLMVGRNKQNIIIFNIVSNRHQKKNNFEIDFVFKWLLFFQYVPCIIDSLKIFTNWIKILMTIASRMFALYNR